MLLFIQTLMAMSSCTSQPGPLTTQLHPGIYQVNNQYFYSEPVRTYLIELEDKLLLFDIPRYSEELKAVILDFEKPVFAILSHGSCGIADGSKWQETIGLKVYAHKADEDHPWIRMRPGVLFTSVPHFADNIEVIHTPGHSAGSICVLEKTSRSLFTGDTFYADATGNVRDFTQERQPDYENLEERIRSCYKLLDCDFENVYPFHYEVITGNAKNRLSVFLKDLESR